MTMYRVSLQYPSTVFTFGVLVEASTEDEAAEIAVERELVESGKPRVDVSHIEEASDDDR